MINLTVPLILASSSPRRKQLLLQIGLKFTTASSYVEEIIDDTLLPEENVKKLSFQKAEEITRSLETGLIIGSDTIVVINNRVLGKPANIVEAKKMLLLLSGKTHSVYTGFAIVDVRSKKSYIDFEKTDVTFRSLSEKEIDEYVASGSPLDKAGSYGIQDDFGAVFIERINGDYYTVVGLPLSKFYVALQQFAEELGYLKG
jgi:septum formation protein